MPAPVAPGSPDNSDDEGQTNKAATHGRLVKLWKERVAGQRAPKGKFRFRTAFRNCIFDVCHAKGWKETDSETDWDFLWVERDWIRGVYDKIRLDDHQRVNHFRNFFELTRKDCMIKNLKRAKRNLAKNGHTDEADQYDFYPDTFTLPGEYLLFVEEFKKQASKDAMWIMKPIGKCQGAGIFLFDKLSQISEWRNDTRWKPENPQAEKYVAQRYIPNPYLIGGKKFDLRLYVLCTSYQPLTIYMYREGFARFTSSRFTMAHGNMADKYIHLTNVAIQKKGDNYDQDTGGKMHVRDLKLYLISKYGIARVNQLFCEIQLVVIRSLQAVQHIIINDKQSFELYGFDVLIDSDLKAWLIEINAAPSLTANTEDDYNLKFRMLDDTLSVIDMDRKLTGNEEQVGGYDLIYRTGFVKFDHNCTVTSYLGCYNNRQRQLKRLAKQIKKRKEAEKITQQSVIQNMQDGKDRSKTTTGGTMQQPPQQQQQITQQPQPPQPSPPMSQQSQPPSA